MGLTPATAIAGADGYCHLGVRAAPNFGPPRLIRLTLMLTACFAPACSADWELRTSVELDLVDATDRLFLAFWSCEDSGVRPNPLEVSLFRGVYDAEANNVAHSGVTSSFGLAPEVNLEVTEIGYRNQEPDLDEELYLNRFDAKRGLIVFESSNPRNQWAFDDMTASDLAAVSDFFIELVAMCERKRV